MFGFDRPEDGSEDRFHERLKVFDEKKQHKAKHHFWWVIHNCVSHPLIGVLPIKPMFDFHDYTSRKINGQ